MVKTSWNCRNAMIIIWVFILAVGTLMITFTAKAEAAIPAVGVDLKVDGVKIALDEPPLIREGRLYVPVSSIAEMFAAKSIRWNSASEEAVIYTALGDKIVLGNRVPVVYYNGGRYMTDAEPFLVKGRIYAPLRLITGLMHATVSWKGSGEPVELTTVKPAIVTASTGFSDISAQCDCTEAELLKLNGLKSADDASEGQVIRIIVPTILNTPAKPYTEADYELLSKITQVEAGDDTYEGQLAVANIILNRVKSDSFPDTIKGVIYSGRQFPPAHNGLLDKSVPKAEAYRAAKDALNGKNNIGDAVYFFNPDVTKGKFWSDLEVVAKIGGHWFAK